MTTARPRAILYLRLSESDDASTSIARQEADLRTRADREGWNVVRVLTDDGLSGGKRRARADEALSLLGAGRADVLAVWKFDRWSRQGLGALSDLIEVLDQRPTALFVADRDGLSSGQPAWRIIAAVLAEVARMERENTQTRVRSSIAALRRSGRYSGGNLPWGYRAVPNSDGPGRVLVLDDVEASLVREVAEAVLGGRSLYAVAHELNGRGLVGRRGAVWTVQTLRQMLTSDAILGRVTHRGEVLRDEATGLPLEVWPPVLDIDTVHRLRAAVEAPKPNTGSRRRPANARLLSGVASCSECTAPLYVRVTGKGLVTYACSARSNGRMCAGVSVSAVRLEEWAESEFLARHGSCPEVVRQAATAPDTDLAEVERAISETTAAMGADDADIAALAARLLVLKTHRAEVRSQPSEPDVLLPTGRTLAEAWAGGTGEDRRHLIAANVAAMAVRKGVRGRTGPLSPSRVSVVWQVAFPTLDADARDYTAGRVAA